MVFDLHQCHFNNAISKSGEDQNQDMKATEKDAEALAGRQRIIKLMLQIL